MSHIASAHSQNGTSDPDVGLRGYNIFIINRKFLPLADPSASLRASLLLPRLASVFTCSPKTLLHLLESQRGSWRLSCSELLFGKDQFSMPHSCFCFSCPEPGLPETHAAVGFIFLFIFPSSGRNYGVSIHSGAVALIVCSHCVFTTASADSSQDSEVSPKTRLLENHPTGPAVLHVNR